MVHYKCVELESEKSNVSTGTTKLIDVSIGVSLYIVCIMTYMSRKEYFICVRYWDFGNRINPSERKPPGDLSVYGA